MPDTDRWWPALADVTGLDPADPRFDTHDKRCGEHRLELIEVLDEAFKKRDASHWRKVFTEGQMSADVIEDYSYPAGDQAAIDNRYVLEVDAPGAGAVKTLGFPVYMTDTPAELRAPAPAVGEHSTAVLRELGELDDATIADLQAQGVVG
jgi:crotonobetainyl-CoA:carnitine CoA-transferase CaiB-like acyl-CoA transferase